MTALRAQAKQIDKENGTIVTTQGRLVEKYEELFPLPEEDNTQVNKKRGKRKADEIEDHELKVAEWSKGIQIYLDVGSRSVLQSLL